MVVDAVAPWAELVLFTADDLAALPEDGWLYELVDGRLVRMSLPGAVLAGHVGFVLSSPGEPEDAGVKVVWVVWPARHEIEVWDARDPEKPRTLRGDDELDGGDVLPGFAIPVAGIWS